MYDYATDVPELMQSLNNLVVQGKVLYLGISDTPAWFVVKANAYARQHGLRPFSIYQGRFSAQLRDLERDVIPMCRHEGMAIHAFGVLGAGYFKSPGSEKQEGRNVGGHMRVGREEQLSVVLDKVAKRHGVPITNVALAYALQKVSQCPPGTSTTFHHCVCHNSTKLEPVLGALYVPHRWWPKGGASQGQCRGSQPGAEPRRRGRD